MQTFKIKYKLMNFSRMKKRLLPTNTVQWSNNKNKKKWENASTVSNMENSPPVREKEHNILDIPVLSEIT